MENFFHRGEKSGKTEFGKLTWYSILIIVIILAATLTRFINLGDRVMSHDEVNHVVPSFDFYTGVGYQHNPVSHGPLQFHLIAFSYFLFGDSDFTSRIPHALASMATIIFVLFAFRKHFGKSGATISSILLLISPFLMFYGRYARNEALVVLFLVIILYAIMRYFKKRDTHSLLILSVVLSLYFTSKETAYIHTAIFMIFFFFKMLAEIFSAKLIQRKPLLMNFMLIFIIFAALGASVYLYRNTDLTSIDSNALTIQGDVSITFQGRLYYTLSNLKVLLLGIIPLLIGIVAVVMIRKYLRWDLLSASPSFNILILLVILVLPLLAAFPVRLCGVDPTLYTSATSNVLDPIYILYLGTITIILSRLWNPKHWWKFLVIFYTIFFLLYTTFLTNMQGSLSGIVGSLGYWLNQQEVNRGNQPLYYYALLQMPFYEFLPIAGSLLAVVLSIAKKKSAAKSTDQALEEQPESTEVGENKPVIHSFSISNLLLFLGISSLIAFTIAGEKMPWLTVQITLPFLLLAGKGLGTYIDSINWKERSARDHVLSLVLSLCILVVTFFILGSLLGNEPPFQGKTQTQLQTTYGFLFKCVMLAGLIVVYRFSHKQQTKSMRTKYFILSFFVILGLLTGQSALRASFVNYDYPKEYLVYAHAAPGPKEILAQVEEISQRTTGGLDIRVAYDNHALYPFWWYFRNYPNRIAYLENPTRNLADVPIILAGQENYGSVEPIIRNNYYTFEYYRLWWPNQDYYNLTGERIVNALTSADMRQALMDIWLKRDYSQYAQTNNNAYLTLSSWLPSEKMRMYIRKDIADQMWDFVSEEKLTQTPSADEWDAITTILYPDQFLGGDGVLNEPRGIDIAVDGSIYVADSKNNQIKRFSTGGTLLDAWGSFGSTTDQSAAGGTFYEPWDVATAPDGSVYVADTWNHRIQKFTADGTFLRSWGFFAQGSSELGYWGPRSVTVDEEGNVYFSDTGNKRIVVFDEDGNFMAQFGSAGTDYGQFNEPVGIALDSSNNLYIADTWNRRVQVVSPNLDLNTSTTLLSWDVDGWYGESIENKPFIAVNAEGKVFVSDPEGALILEYSPSGELLHVWDLRGVQDDQINMPVDIEFDDEGTMWVSDAASNMIYGYILPAD